MYPIVGQRGDGLCRYKGSVDDLLIWNTALSQQEIQQYMNCPPAVSESGLVGYWNFEEGSGSTASDQTANANNGTINGATYETNVPESCALTNINGCDSTAVLNLTMLPCDAVSTFCGEGTVWDADSQECIVANPTDTNFDGCTDLNDLLDILSAYGECAVSEFTCGDEIEHENYSYSTVQIGDQCWFNENCCYLPEVSPSNEGSETDPYYYVYDYQGTDIEEAKATDNYETYGVLYNWPAVMTEAICPTSWHVPSDGEWQTMEVSLGMSESEASSFGWRGTDEGYQMKSTSGWWYNDDNGSNSSGFSGLPGGYRGGFVLGMYQVGVDGYWWTSSEADSNSFKRGLGDGLSNPNKVARALFNPNGGISARCIKD
jgi:uncharacterized protein (TIGR02145 family)